MKYTGTIVALLIIALLALFFYQPESFRSLTLITSGKHPDKDIANKLAELLKSKHGIGITVSENEKIEEGGTYSNLTAILNRQADLSIIENNAPFLSDISTIVPLHPRLLLVLYRSETNPKSFDQLVRGKTVNVGPRKGMAARFFSRFIKELGIEEKDVTITNNPVDDIDVYFRFGDILSLQNIKRLSRFRLFSFDSIADLGKGSFVETIATRHPQLKPYVIPKLTYGLWNPDPIVTLSVDSILVGHSDVDEKTVYLMVKTIIENKQEFASISPMLFHGLHDNFDVDNLNYPVHPGTRRYLERNEPSFVERYAEVIGVGFTIFFTLIGALITLRNWSIQRKKDRIDVYYEKLLDIRRSIARVNSPDMVDKIVRDVRDIQEEAFQLLIDEKVSADESFRIFITLCNDVVREVEGQLMF